ncbi:MAG: IS110 family transposase [Verrucomicrobia bacterium]|nr:IS110 family transposase [Verrucomicrobiota bacterium]
MNPKAKQTPETPPASESPPRVIGLDAHPDSFTAAILRGPTPAAALVEKLFNQVPMARLQSWAQKHTTAEDILLLEASGNSFQIVRSLAAVGRKARVLESCQMGKLKEAHANNDKISAVRIGKAWLAGTAKSVWVPDAQTQERRDWFHAHRKALKRTTQMRNRLRSYLSDNGVRLKRNTRLTDPAKLPESLRAARDWSPRQWQVLEGLMMELQHAEQQRQHWRRLIAQEVLGDAMLLSLVRLCGVREMVAFALGAFIGPIERFAEPRKLVKYIGLNPAFDDSGAGHWQGGIGGHGRKDLRCLLIEAAQAILRCGQTALGRWGRKLLGRKGSVPLAVAAVARKLVVAVWYLMKGRFSAVEEIEAPLSRKIGKIISQVGSEALNKLGKSRQPYRQEIYRMLQEGRVYVLNRNKTFQPAAA